MTDLLAGLPQILKLANIFVAWPVIWIVTALLWHLSREDPEGEALRVTAWFVTAIALLVTTFVAVFINNDLPVPPLPLWATQVITRGSFLGLVTFACFLWLRWYGRRDGE